MRLHSTNVILFTSIASALLFAACGDTAAPTPALEMGEGGAGLGGASAPEHGVDRVQGALAGLDCSVQSSDGIAVPEGGTPVFGGGQSFGSYVADGVDVVVEAVGVEGQQFESAWRATAGVEVSDNWSAQLVTSTTAEIAAGDALLAEVWVRCEKSRTESGECSTEFVLELGEDPYTKSVTYPMTVGHEYRRFLIPFEAAENYSIGAANLSIRLGYKEQSLDVGKVAVLNYGKQLSVEELPKTQITYRGMEDDAAWRLEAAERIEKHRKGPLKIMVTRDGKPVPGAPINVTQQEHEYAFGSAVSANFLSSSEGSSEGDTYRAEAARLFNTVTLENALKWQSLAGDWGPGWGLELAKGGLDWAESEGLDVRGHVLVWPSWRNLPAEMESLKDDPAALREAVYEHIDWLTGETQGRLTHWDVLNEPFDNHDLMDILGEAEMLEWFKRARAGAPDAKLFINDYAILSGGEGETPHRDHYFDTIQYLVSEHAELDGIGMQGHFGSGVTPPEAVLSLLDRFAAFDKEIVITEYDISTEDETVSACFTRDFLTAVFSHEASSGFVTWGYWDGAHWHQDAPFFEQDWTQKLPGKVFEELVLSHWWTQEELKTNDSGEAQVRAFHGTHEVVVSVDGQAESRTIDVEAGAEETILNIAL